MSCLFCKIVAGEIPCDKVHESENFLAFKDINPQARVHVLVIPKKHVENISEAAERFDKDLLGSYMKEIAEVAMKLGVKDSGYRLVMNTNGDGCQTVFHLHAHILGGGLLSGKMG